MFIRASDTDVLVLTCYSHQQLSPENDWLMKTDSERYVSVTSIKLYFGKIMCSVLPTHHFVLQDMIQHRIQLTLVK